MEAQGERMYCSYSFSTSALDGVSGQRHAPAVIYPRGKDPQYPLYRRLGRPQSRSGHTGHWNIYARNSGGLIYGSIRRLPGGTEENHEKPLSQDSRSPSRDSRPEPPEYRVLPTQPRRSVCTMCTDNVQW
jgi:hypothetical protein